MIDTQIQLINDIFNEIKLIDTCENCLEEKISKIESKKKELIPILDTVFKKRDFKKLYHTSVGCEGGATRFQDIRIKKIGPQKSELSVIVNIQIKSATKNTFPEILPYAINVEKYFLSEDFPGVILTDAPYEILSKHLSFSNSISHISLNIESVKEQYEEKMKENVATLKKKYNIQEQSGIEYLSIIQKYLDNAQINFFDRSLNNVKYMLNNNNNFKLFEIPDWSRSYKLVIPAYDAVQIACSSQKKHYLSLKEQSRKELTIPEFDFLWELGEIYYVTRQLTNAIKDNDKINIKKYESLILEKRFQIIENVNPLFENISKSIH